MAILSGLFNSVRDSEGQGDRKYDAEFFSLYLGAIVGNGVFPNPSTGLQVLQYENMSTVVKTGMGWIKGRFIYNNSDHILQHDIAHGVFKRIDRVVMRLDYTTRLVDIVIKKGADGSNPVAPTLQRDAEAYELALADVLIASGAIQITQSNIKDTRLDKNLCGITHGLVDQVDTTTLFNQYQTWFAEQMAAYESNMVNWTNEQQSLFIAWIATQEQDMDNWTSVQRQAYLDWMDQQQTDMSVWTAAQQQSFLDWTAQQRVDFTAWFNDLQDMLDGDVAANLAGRIIELENNRGNFKVESDVNNKVFITFPQHFFNVDNDGKVSYMPDGDGNAGASFGDKIYVWKVM